MNKTTYTVNRVSRKNIRSLGTRPQEGQSLVEYSLLLGLIAVAVIAVISVLGVQLNDTFTSVTSSLGGTSVPYTPGATSQAAATPTPVSNNGGSGSGGSGSGGSGSGGSGGGGGSPTIAAAPTAAPTATPVPATAAPTATPAPTTAPATTAAPTTAATTKPTTAAPTATPAPTSTPVPTTAAPTATPVPTTAAPTTPAGSGLYTVAYNKTNQWYTWNNGTPVATTYEVNVVITNKSSSTVNSWTISWKLENNESFYNYWNANCVINGSHITCTNPSGYNTVMAPNGTVSFYVQLNSSNMNYTVPKSYTVNGTKVAA